MPTTMDMQKAVKQVGEILTVFESRGCPDPLEIIFLWPDGQPARSIKHPELSPGQARKDISSWINEAEEYGQTLIFRMTGKGREFRPVFHVDNCDEATVRLLRDYCFLQVRNRNSLDRYQCWLSLPSATSEKEVTQIHKRMLKRFKKKGTLNGWLVIADRGMGQ